MALPIPKRLRGVNGGAASHSRAKHQERQLAARLSRVTRGSGNKMERGDVRVDKIMRVECKSTINKSFSITREMLQKIKTAAFGSREVPAIHVEFLNKQGRVLEEVAVVPMWVLEGLICKKA